jgi:hypothetical protein
MRRRTFLKQFVSQDGLTLWLCYSANDDRKADNGYPFGSGYALCLHELRFEL